MNIAIITKDKKKMKSISIILEKMSCHIYTFVCMKEMEKLEISFDLFILDADITDDDIQYLKKHREQNILLISRQSHEEERLFQIIKEVIDEIQNRDYITLKVKTNNQRFLIEDIVYMQYIGYKAIGFVYQNHSYVVKGYTLKELEGQMKNQFIYIDRGTLINKSKMIKLVENQLYIAGINQAFTVSSRRKRAVKQIISDFRRSSDVCFDIQLDNHSVRLENEDGDKEI